MTPKKKESTLTTKLRGVNATNTAQPSKACDKDSDPVITVSSPEDIIKAMKKIRDVLLQDVIRKDQKSDARQTVDMAIAVMNEGTPRLARKQVSTKDSVRLSNIENQIILSDISSQLCTHQCSIKFSSHIKFS
jgi:hypothetical protein